MTDQSLREWMASKFLSRCTQHQDLTLQWDEIDFETQQDYLAQADSILTELNRRIDASALTPEQLGECFKVTGYDEHGEPIETPIPELIAAA